MQLANLIDDERGSPGLPAIQALRDRGAVWSCDVDHMRRGVLRGRAVTRQEADALFEVERADIEKCPEWTAFFVEVITHYVVWETRPTGLIDSAKAEWLIARTVGAATLNGLAVLVEVLSEAHRVPLWFVATVRARAARGWAGVSEVHAAALLEAETKAA